MITAMWIATGILAFSALLGLVRIFTANDAATRAVISDLVYFSGVGILMIQGMLHRSSVSVDLALIAAIVGVLATIALSRILTRGRR